ncbi:ribosomal protein L7/L12 [Blastopirellula sp. JC732]|uniref:Ribosomal protein L7/L12 n=1 Tax=Blastopirellula sediminis TaxID=2894196 RepID=A0A9X1MQ51_9BACT|nr:ribosomal protein L7/L12 [Blastopirellula sediminis]MCC9605824.1 ribosomal protein L7/L12 [Blastopirellula sediminis]MCC9630876.1 ribosomal protein L7/L12 [Blastopirellula sediminis]
MDVENEDSTDGQLDEIKRLIKERQKIAAIKLLREQTGRGLKEAKDLVEQIEAKMVADGELDKASSVGCSGMILLGAAVLGAGTAAWLFA